MQQPVDLGDGVVFRELRPGDGPALAAAYLRNREHLAPWEPSRSEEFFDVETHRRDVEAAITRLEAGLAVPFVITDGDEIIGRMNLSDIVRGAFQNANLGYWVDGRYNGRGIATMAVGLAVHAARGIGLHRVQAGTLVHNAASQAVLAHNGFERFGLARRYLRIAGEWRDHVLFERLLDE
ncbi:acetyltransferase [Agromyces sp. Root81]|uniref:GNAT family N-acetyltransferase n=1 Tax=Agromyces sp. Root81 TaxID=1736601 RepID=UPI0006FC3760|nr:GNAT family N-acetyltransferase [Agromyces sp. Root81]KRC60855.1 acetyltransferase [Agromyces sp. Root81]